MNSSLLCLLPSFSRHIALTPTLLCLKFLPEYIQRALR
ncbi:hypothetical protein NC653_022147 [Populus alba x Populus x berolinensis]|uniref:Uncharacterized protein n=1 Tax=Populus alba x Populus x berolinensis TaxID=444605 RepID=A0AAD6QFP7_9ROSI|nr:hypothetical protein NC653_022147 [Populus alba x Populus x berolinensis]